VIFEKNFTRLTGGTKWRKKLGFQKKKKISGHAQKKEAPARTKTTKKQKKS